MPKGKHLSEIVGKQMSDKILGTKKGEKLGIKLDPAIKQLVDAHFDDIFDPEIVPKPKDENSEKMNSLYEYGLARYAESLMKKNLLRQV